MQIHKKMQSGIVMALSVFKANVILQGSMTGGWCLVSCDPPVEDLKQTSQVTSKNCSELEIFKELWSEFRFQPLPSEQKERFLMAEPVLLFTPCCSWSIKIIPLNPNIALFSSHFCLNAGHELISWDHTQCSAIAAPHYYSVGMKISAAKKGLHHRDVAQSLCEKSQKFIQEIRHHNPINSEGYRRAPAFFTWSLTNIFDRDVCSCTDILFNTILTFYIQI